MADVDAVGEDAYHLDVAAASPSRSVTMPASPMVSVTVRRSATRE